MSNRELELGRKHLQEEFHKLRETVAAVQHDLWSHWMEYQFSKCIVNPDGSLTIPAESVKRWLRQSQTTYADLPESERESDRHQADKVLNAMKMPQKYGV
jgi:hypothetical protein